MHYSMTQPISVLITGIDKQKVLDQAFLAVKTFKPMEDTARWRICWEGEERGDDGDDGEV